MIAAIAVLNANRPAMSFVTFSIAQCALRTRPRSSPVGSERHGLVRGRVGDLRAQAPQPAQEPVHALDALVGPVGVLVGRPDEQDVRARRVRAVALDDRSAGEIDVPARLGHLRAVAGDHALGEQPRERLLHVQVAEIRERLREEARVHQVQDRVLDAADVLVDRHPVVDDRRDPTRPRRCPGRSSAGSTRTSRRTCPSCPSRAGRARRSAGTSC